MWDEAVLEEENSLPCAEGHAATGHRNSLARARHRHAQMARCVVRSFRRMDVPSFSIRRDAVEKLMQVLARRRIGVLVNDQARAGVADEDRDNPFLETGGADNARNLVGDLVAAAPARADLENFGLGDHDIW